MQQVYYKRITTWLAYPNNNEICEDYVTYGLNRHNWVEVCRTVPLADMKERQRLVAETLNVAPDQIELVKKLGNDIGSNTIPGYVREFIENESFRKQSRSDQVYLTHEILSFSANEDAKHLTDEMLADIAREYIQLRGQKGVMLGAVRRDKDHVHIHFCVSALEFRTGKSFGLSKAALRGLKIQLQDFHRQKYPEISQSFPQHGIGKPYLNDRAWQAQHREERSILKEQIKATVQTCFEKTATQQNFLEMLRGHDLHHYERSGKPAGIEYQGVKFRFSRLLEKEQFESLPVNLSEEQKVLEELRMIREQRQIKDKEERDYEDDWDIAR